MASIYSQWMVVNLCCTAAKQNCQEIEISRRENVLTVKYFLKFCKTNKFSLKTFKIFLRFFVNANFFPFIFKNSTLNIEFHPYTHHVDDFTMKIDFMVIKSLNSMEWTFIFVQALIFLILFAQHGMMLRFSVHGQQFLCCLSFKCIELTVSSGWHVSPASVSRMRNTTRG